MVRYEYKVIPAPAKGLKAPGVKGAEARFAHTLEQRMNEMAAEGWEYLRADILPSEERQGLTSTQTVYRSVLVFRRGIEAAVEPVVVTEAFEDAIEDDAPDAEETVEDTAPETSEPPETPEDTASDDDDATETEKKDSAP